MREKDIRYPMRRTLSPRWVEPDDVNVLVKDQPLIGRKVAEMILSEQALAKIGAKALEAATQEMGAAVAYSHRPGVDAQVVKLLADTEWLKPIVEQEIRRCAREMVMSLWSAEEKKALRQWFDVLTAATGTDTPQG